MKDTNQYTIHDPEGKPILVHIRPDRRLKKSVRWVREENGDILMRVPYRTPKQSISRLLEEIARQLKNRHQLRDRRTDEELQKRATYVNRRHFNGELSWSSIRWTTNMRNRLGSCTNGGTTDGDIRISDRIRGWPQWVIDYVIAHELAHRRYANHGPEFWAYLRAAYPQTERALGFIQGISFAHNEPLNADD
ncbi:MAG: M48 family metallopeptidase [Anaerolineae bacterium]|nr:M48 family metallopeptidase [Anaerolineae bacterium]